MSVYGVKWEKKGFSSNIDLRYGHHLFRKLDYIVCVDRPTYDVVFVLLHICIVYHYEQIQEGVRKLDTGKCILWSDTDMHLNTLVPSNMQLNFPAINIL